MTGRRRKKSKQAHPALFRLMLALLAVATALLAATVLILIRPTAFREVPEEPGQEVPEDTVVMGGQEVVIDRTLPQSELEREHFRRQEDGTVTYTGEARYGIDVSAHQGEIDWAQVAEAGVEFAVLRIGYRGYSAGALNPDEQFEANYQGAVDNGLEVGVYFFSQAVNEEEAREEAEQVLTWLEDREAAFLAYDWEPITDDTARTDGLDGETVTACAKAFCETVRAAGKTPMVYCNGMLGYLSYDLNQLDGCGLWYAEYEDYPSYAYEVDLWQYTNTGTVAGIQGPVDRNIWFR